MICSASLRKTNCPVVAKTSGIVFDRQVIESCILADGKCPLTGEPLTMDDILPIRAPPPKELCNAMPEVIVEHIRESFKMLQLRRRYYREIPASLTCFDAIQKYVLCNTLPLHKTDMQGILSLDIHKSKEIIATGGADANAIVSDQVTGNVISRLEGHSKQVTSLKFVENDELLVTGSADSTVRVWQRSDDGNYNFKHMFHDHIEEVRAVTIHPTGKYFISASLDRTWIFYGLSSDLRMIRVTRFPGSEQFLTAAFHPDGHIIGTGTSRFVRFWDVAKQDDIIKINAHDGPVTSMAFSENGFHLATAAEDGVKLWDLRFLRTFMTFPSDGNAHKCPVDFDLSGRYLVSGGSQISAYNIVSAPNNSDIITAFPKSGIAQISCLKFGNDAKYVAAGSVDSSNLSLFSLPGGNDSMESQIC